MTNIKKLKKQLKKAEKKAKREARQTTALAIVEPVAVVAPNRTALVLPQSFEELERLAVTMSDAGAMVGKAFRRNPGACQGIILQAVRWQLDPFAISHEAYLVNDSIGYSGKMIAGVIQANAGLKSKLRVEYGGKIADGTRRAKIFGTFRGEKKAHELITPIIRTCQGKSPLWKKDPDQQLYYFGARAWARRYAPEVMLGLISTDEADVAHELDDERTDTEKKLAGAKTKRLAAMEKKKAAAKKNKKAIPADDEDVVDAEFEEIDQTAEPEITSVPDDGDNPGEREPETKTKPAPKATKKKAEVKPKDGTVPYTSEMHDFLEHVNGDGHVLEELEAQWADEKKTPAFKDLTQDQKLIMADAVNKKLAEIKGE